MSKIPSQTRAREKKKKIRFIRSLADRIFQPWFLAHAAALRAVGDAGVERFDWRAIE